MLQFSSCGYSRNDLTLFVLLLGSIQSAPMGSCTSAGSVESLPPLPKTFPVWKRAEKSCHHHPTALTAPRGTSQNHSQGVPQQLEWFLLCFFTTRYPKWSCNSQLETVWILQGSWRWGWRQDLLPSCCRMHRRQQRGTCWVFMAGKGKKQQLGEGQTLAFSTLPQGSSRRVGLVVAQTTRKERSDHSGLSLHNSRINSVNKAVA